MAPVFVLLQEVEGKRGGGPPRGSGTVRTTRALAPATAAPPGSSDRLLAAPVMIPQPLTETRWDPARVMNAGAPSEE
ncbi:hypothetical protein fugu_016159 [Takifugu bimaculatus]|uniref:Uncharacterized protein n=1 Tax=Takifugu bimaculatus TaxID=433685 RepID=A0A4Z2BXM7_9TELE|nr:hypothetical protein fugu_016159 [Takifugu bimaculatus]